MKHSWKITLFFVALFLVSHVLGLFLLSNSVSFSIDDSGQKVIAFKDTFVGERPVMSDLESIIYLAVGVAIGTLVLLFFAKKKKQNWWRIWFLVAAWMTITVSLQALFGSDSFWLSALAAILALWKVYKPNMIVHNLTEIFVYTGIVLIFVPMFSVLSMFIVLILVSIYDAYAVWKSKHMITLAKFTRDSNLFPGFTLRNKQEDVEKIAIKASSVVSSNTSKGKVGILGGGDVVFPLLFSGAIFVNLLKKGMSLNVAFLFALIVSLFAALGLFLLFYFSKKDKFYPAMPFLSAGAFIGYFVALVLF